MAGLLTLARVGLEIVFPKACVGCAETGVPVLCSNCASLLERPRADPIPGLQQVLAAFVHAGAARDALLLVKLGGERRGAADLAQYMPAATLTAATVTWVPDTYAAKARRGGSVTEQLARAYATRMKLPVTNLLTKVRTTRDLGGASKTERLTAMRGAFVPKRRVPERIVLVDDVVTTGSTALACAAALKAGGARQVVVASFTRAELRSAVRRNR